MRSDGGMLWYLLNKIRGGGASNDRGNTPAFGFDGTDDYISSNATIGRTGYDMNVSGNVSTGSDGDGSYIQFNGNRNFGTSTGSKASILASTLPTITQATSFSMKVRCKILSNAVAVNESGLFAGLNTFGIFMTATALGLQWALRGSTHTTFVQSSAFTLGQLLDLYLVYDASVSKFYAYMSTGGGASTLLNVGGTAGPATFTGSNLYLGDDAITGGNSSSANKYIYHAAIRNKALTQAEIDADIALGNTAKNDPSIVAYYIPDNLQYNTQYMLDPKDLSSASWPTVGGTTVTANTTVAPDGTTTADTVAIPASALNRVEQPNLTITGSALASKTFIIKAFVKVAAGTSTFRLRMTHRGVADYQSADLTATTTRQEYTFTQTFTSSTSGTGITGAVLNGTDALVKSLQVRNVRAYLVNETLRDESPNIGGYIGWKTQKVLSCRYKPAADFADSATAGALMVIPRAYMHDRASDHRPQIRYDDRLSARTSIATPLGVGFRGKVHVLGVIYWTGSAFATKFYTNGVLQDSDTRAAIPASSFIQSILESGRRSTTYFSGNIREQRIYTFTGSFTDADALAIYNGGEPTSPGVTKYLHYKPLSGEIGTATSDLSGNLRDGTLNGGVTRVVV